MSKRSLLYGLGGLVLLAALIALAIQLGHDRTPNGTGAGAGTGTGAGAGAGTEVGAGIRPEPEPEPEPGSAAAAAAPAFAPHADAGIIHRDHRTNPTGTPPRPGLL